MVSNLVRGLRRPLVRGLVPTGSYNWLQHSPSILTDVDVAALKSGGGAAEMLDLVATLSNTGTGSDATQATASEQGVMLKKVDDNYLYLPGIDGNKALIDTPLVFDATKAWHMTFDLMMVTANSVNLFTSSTGSLGRIYFYNDGDNLALGSTLLTLDTAFTFDQRVVLEIIYDLTDIVVKVDGVEIYNAAGSLSTQMSSFDQLGHQWPGATGVPDMRGCFHSAKVVNDGSTLMDIDFTVEAHNDTSFVCTSGQTVSVVSTGSDIAKMIGYSCLRFDHTDDWYHGTFASDLVEGHMFAVYDVLDAATGYDRVLSCGATGNNDTAGSSIIPSTSNGADLEVYKSGNILNHTGGWSGRIFHEAKFEDGATLSRLNNADEQTGTPTFTLQLQEFGIGAEFSNGNSNAGIDLLFLGLFPADLSTDAIDEIRAELNTRFDLY